MERYEDALFELGFRVVRVSIHTLSILNLLSQRLVEARNFAVIALMDGHFSVSIFKEGVLDFYRSKSLPDAAQLATEVGTSFTFYRGRNYGVEFEKIVLAGGGEAEADLVGGVTGAAVEIVKSEDIISGGVAEGGTASVSIDSVPGDAAPTIDMPTDASSLLAALGAASF